MISASTGLSSSGSSTGSGFNVPAAVDALVVQVPDLPDELVGELVDRGLHVAGGLARAQRAALEVDGRLGNLRLGDRRVPLDRELDLDLRQLVDAAVELLELPLDIAPDGVVHLEVLALDVKLHRRLPCRCLDDAEASSVFCRASAGSRRRFQPLCGDLTLLGGV